MKRHLRREVSYTLEAMWLICMLLAACAEKLYVTAIMIGIAVIIWEIGKRYE